jgi:RNA polymerase sigma-70 factor (ECF subfamily)
VTAVATSTLAFPVPEVQEPIDSAERLAERCKAGCQDSFEQLVRMFQNRIYSYLVQFVGNAHDAEDIAQETFVKAYKSMHRYDSHYRFSTWLFTIAKNTALSFRRGQKIMEPIETIAERLIIEEENSVDGELVWKTARTLKPKQFEALWLRYAEGFSVEEAAKIMRMNQISLKVVLHRARNALGKKLKLQSGLGIATTSNL